MFSPFKIGFIYHFLVFLQFLLSTPNPVASNTECAWATGRLLCHKNQTKVLGAIVELWDLDSPQNSRLQNPVDPDDKASFTIVTEESGLFQLDGCASDHDWLPGIVNRPEFYLRVHHQCNSEQGEFYTIMPIFRVYTPATYDYHIGNPIVLDTPTMPVLNGSTNGGNSGQGQQNGQGNGQQNGQQNGQNVGQGNGQNAGQGSGQNLNGNSQNTDQGNGQQNGQNVGQGNGQQNGQGSGQGNGQIGWPGYNNSGSEWPDFRFNFNQNQSGIVSDGQMELDDADADEN